MSDKVEELLDLFTQIPRNREGSNIKYIAQAIGLQLNQLFDGITDIVDSRSISKAIGYELDLIGNLVSIPRITDESDNDYRERLLYEILNPPERNTIQALKDEVERLTDGYIPEIREYFDEDPFDMEYLELLGIYTPYGVVDVKIPVAYDSIYNTIKVRLDNVKAAGVSLILSEIEDFTFSIDELAFVSEISRFTGMLYLEEHPDITVTGERYDFGYDMVFGQFVFGSGGTTPILNVDVLDLVKIYIPIEIFDSYDDVISGEMDYSIDEDYISISITDEYLFGIWHIEDIGVFITDELTGSSIITNTDIIADFLDDLDGSVSGSLIENILSLVDDLIDKIGLATVELIDITLDDFLNVQINLYESSEQWTFGSSAIFGQVLFGGQGSGNSDSLDLVGVSFAPDIITSLIDNIDFNLITEELVSITILDELDDISSLMSDEYTITISDSLDGSMNDSFLENYSELISDSFDLETAREESVSITIQDDIFGQFNYQFNLFFSSIDELLEVIRPLSESYVGQITDNIYYDLVYPFSESISDSNIYDSLDDSSLTFVSWLFGNPEATFGKMKFGGSHTDY